MGQQSQIWVLGESQLSFPDGAELDGVTQGNGSHLLGKTIRLNSHDMQRVDHVDRDETFDDSDGSQKLTGDTTLDGVTYAEGTRIEAEYRLTLTDPESGESWEAVGFNVNEPGGAAAFGTVEGLAFIGPPGSLPPTGVDLVVTATGEGPRDIPTTDYVSPLCLAAGTAIATPTGPVAVERLAPGDRVLLGDGDTAPVQMCLTRTLDAAEMARDPRLRPVRISAGALGHGLPARDLVVSRQHRLLASSPIVRRMFGVSEVLIAAHRLTAMPGIFIDERLPAVTYVHLVLDAHRVIFAEGTPTESFYPGPVALRSLPRALVAEVERLFPGAATGDIRSVAARAIPPRSRQSRCVARHLRNRTSLLSGLRMQIPRDQGAPARATGASGVDPERAEV